MNFVLISSSGVPTMTRGLTSSRLCCSPHCMMNVSDAASIQREKFGKKTMPAVSQSPNSIDTRYRVVFIGGRTLSFERGSARRHAQRAVEPDHFAVQCHVLDD